MLAGPELFFSGYFWSEKIIKFEKIEILNFFEKTLKNLKISRKSQKYKKKTYSIP